MNQVIKFDFTQGVEQVEVAVMPAHLAQKLLANYAESLSLASIDTIVGNFIDNLRDAKKDGLAHTINVAREWVDERTLIHNISTNNWDVYAVKPAEEEKTSVDEPLNEGVKVIGKINLDDTFRGTHEALTDGI